MSSYIILELDTTLPEIEIYCPSYTTTDLLNEIAIVSNKDSLSDYQEIYVIDRNGDRHDYTFQRENENEYVGYMKFALFPLGLATIYARMMDDVGNLSNLVEKSFEIKESLTILVLDISDKESITEIFDKSKNVEIDDKYKEIRINDKSINIENKDVSMEIELLESDRGVINGNK